VKPLDSAFPKGNDYVNILVPEMLAELAGDCIRSFRDIRWLDISQTRIRGIGPDLCEGFSLLGEVFLPSTMERIGENWVSGSSLERLDLSKTASEGSDTSRSFPQPAQHESPTLFIAVFNKSKRSTAVFP
jgi:hypothetical protein